MTRLTELISQVGPGGQHARDALFAEAYPELRKLARSRLYDGGRNTYLDTTSLVHESYLRFLGSPNLSLDDRRAFFAYASKVMRSVVIDSVREHRAERRGGDRARLTLHTQFEGEAGSDEDEVIRLHDALLALEAVNSRMAKVVEMRYFGGFVEAEIADALDVTERTVRRDWEKARLLLKDALHG